jgi:hypothetical protein
LRPGSICWIWMIMSASGGSLEQGPRLMERRVALGFPDLELFEHAPKADSKSALQDSISGISRPRW